MSIDIELRRAVENVVDGARDPAMGVGGDHDFVHEADNVLAGGHTGNGASEDVVEHQRRDAELGERAAQGFLDHAVDAATHEHRAAFDVDGADRERKKHDADDEPGGRLSDRLLGNAAGVERRGRQVVENNSRGAPDRR